MEKFSVLQGIAIPLARANVDTDLVIPKQYLTTITRTGLGTGLFHELRVDLDGNQITSCVFNQEPYRTQGRIIVAGDNFGCGSSREHAVWALVDYGIRCVVSSSFADIFYNNAIKNGVLPAKVTPEAREALLARAEAEPTVMKVDLPTQTIVIGTHNPAVHEFTIEAGIKKQLLEGWDDIALTLRDLDKITAFEQVYLGARPWLQGGSLTNQRASS